MLDLLVGDFYLATSLRMVGSGYFVRNGVLEKHGFEKSVAKVMRNQVLRNLISQNLASKPDFSSMRRNLTYG